VAVAAKARSALIERTVNRIGSLVTGSYFAANQTIGDFAPEVRSKLPNPEGRVAATAFHSPAFTCFIAFDVDSVVNGDGARGPPTSSEQFTTPGEGFRVNSGAKTVMPKSALQHVHL